VHGFERDHAKDQEIQGALHEISRLRQRYLSVTDVSVAMRLGYVKNNTEYRFISERARKATARWGVKSVSILARKS
jgi:hypothetical protein